MGVLRVFDDLLTSGVQQFGAPTQEPLHRSVGTTDELGWGGVGELLLEPTDRVPQVVFSGCLGELADGPLDKSDVGLKLGGGGAFPGLTLGMRISCSQVEQALRLIPSPIKGTSSPHGMMTPVAATLDRSSSFSPDWTFRQQGLGSPAAVEQNTEAAASKNSLHGKRLTVPSGSVIHPPLQTASSQNSSTPA